MVVASPLAVLAAARDDVVHFNFVTLEAVTAASTLVACGCFHRFLAGLRPAMVSCVLSTAFGTAPDGASTSQRRAARAAAIDMIQRAGQDRKSVV